MKVWQIVEGYTRSRDALANAAAGLLPKRVAYWSLIRSGSQAIRSDEIVPTVPFTTVLQRVGQGLR